MGGILVKAIMIKRNLMQVNVALSNAETELSNIRKVVKKTGGHPYYKMLEKRCKKQVEILHLQKIALECKLRALEIEYKHR